MAAGAGPCILCRINSPILCAVAIPFASGSIREVLPIFTPPHTVGLGSSASCNCSSTLDSLALKHSGKTSGKRSAPRVRKDRTDKKERAFFFISQAFQKFSLTRKFSQETLREGYLFAQNSQKITTF